LLFKITNYFIPLRVSEASEILGLDISQHNESLDYKHHVHQEPKHD
jgi:Amt family ammonium transporter